MKFENMGFYLVFLVYNGLLKTNSSLMERLVFLQKHKRTKRQTRDLLGRSGDNFLSQCVCGSEQACVHTHFLFSAQDY